MTKLSYSTFGLTQLSFLDAIDVVNQAGYPGIEVSFHRDQFNPFEITDEFLATIKKRFETTRVKPACVATASHFFTPSRPHEPSLMSIETAGRKRRINLVKRGIHVARKLGVDLVTLRSLQRHLHFEVVALFDDLLQFGDLIFGLRQLHAKLIAG